MPTNAAVLELTPCVYALIIAVCAVLSLSSPTENRCRRICAALAFSAALAFICGSLGLAARYQAMIFAASSALTAPYSARPAVYKKHAHRPERRQSRHKINKHNGKQVKSTNE